MKDIVVAGVKEARMLRAIDNQINWASVAEGIGYGK